MNITLTAIVPVYNEENTLIKSVSHLLKQNIITEIFIVDDASSDSSLHLINEFKENNIDEFKENKIKIKIFKADSKYNKGKGYTITRVADHIKTDYVVIHDADLEYNPVDIVSMYSFINNNKDNLILGSRFLESNKIQKYFRTFFANKFLSLFFSLLYKKKITDIATCYKMFPSDYFKNTQFNEKGFAIEVELIAKYLKISKEIIEVPISYNARSYQEGKKIKLLDFFKYLFSIIKYRI